MASHEQPGRGFYEATSDRMAQFSSLVPYTPRAVSSRLPMREIQVTRSAHVIDQEDYRLDDPIRLAFIRVLRNLKEQEQGYFSGPLTDCGIGNAAEEIVIGPLPSVIRGIDIRARNLDIAYAVLLRDKYIGARIDEVAQRSNGRKQYFEPYHMDAVDYVASLAPGSLTGVVIANLPQVPSIDKKLVNPADNYQREKYRDYEEKYGKYGLSLRAKFMAQARVAASPDVRVLMFFSEWFDQSVVERMLDETGWEIARTLASPVVQQDRSTNIFWLQDIASEVDGRFFADPQGKNRLSFVNAVDRWQTSQGTDAHPDLYHKLQVYEIKPKAELADDQVVDSPEIQDAAAA